MLFPCFYLNALINVNVCLRSPLVSTSCGGLRGCTAPEQLFNIFVICTKRELQTIKYLLSDC